MKVSELIAYLEECNPNYEVKIGGYELRNITECKDIIDNERGRIELES